MNSLSTASSLWSSLGLPEEYLRHHLKLLGNPAIAVNSSFKIADAAQTSVGLSALAAAYFHHLRTGVEQDVTVNARHAILEFNSQKFYSIEGKPAGPEDDPIMGLYTTKGDGYVRLHTNFPHHRKGLLDILKIEDTPEVTRDQVQEALLKWTALDFENAAQAKHMCAFAMRSFEEWDFTPQAKALLDTPPLSIRKITDAPKRVTSDTSLKHPLEGINVLDLSRVLAGPVAGRTLAAHGANVLLVTSPDLPALPKLDADTSRGKRTTQLDLTSEGGLEKLRELATEADVFLQAYRPGALEKKGFGVQDIARMNGNRGRGVICANLCAWGWEGPWKDKRGFDSLVQTASGLNVAEAEAYAKYTGTKKVPLSPKPFPLQALDFAAGYLLAFGINAALSRTMTEGGSWEVRVSLAAIGQWVRSLGRINPEDAFGQGLPLPRGSSAEEIQTLSALWKTQGGGTMTALRHPAVMSKTPVREGREGEPSAPIVLNAHRAAWL
ncbi:CoA-transferase family III [Marasmius fiardii PR-910]|nr:CoA-transferase family III [Marasmius fiardii PR-910]